MTQAAAVPRPALSKWCGWVLVGGLAVAPLVGWLGPMGFAPLLAAMGVFSLPALRVNAEDRPEVVLLLILLLWAAVSTIWSPFHPSKLGSNVALKLAFELPLYWAAVCGARRADPRLKRLGLEVLAWGSALLGGLLLVEFATDAGMFEALHLRFYGPIRHDIAEVRVAHSTFVLALLAPLAIAAARRTGRSVWLGAPMIAGIVAAGLRFQAEAPALAVIVAAVAALLVWCWPRGGPLGLAGAAVVYVLGAPLVILGVQRAGLYEPIRQGVELSWAMRMDFWRHAVDWIGDHPIRGWGLDSSRVFGPGIILHPHDGALQIWLELGAVGAVLAAAFWFLTLRRLTREARDLGAVAVAASCAVYLLFGALNFGVWQEWWLALGALVAVGAALLDGATPASRST